MTESERVGSRIKAMRKQCGYTQEKVANDLFISQSYLRLIEHGKANPSINMVEKITSYLEAALNGSAGEEVFSLDE
ncbi:helix-turn-helix transcriptional regulator [Clostridiaceae bacterium NSJ-31]|uniref:Helix-turn-helix transcriptional regulator n=1 Tax=Ligaoa zhengdingensis TaxID=2763658 RepID=A0A926I5Z8_9FIRM|nr:helix-turn-helix transcriptional regulator [Ligaoa zhengdingensis]MBC8547821.1 helix-turn-helix transcriptional regulator [Ligaoa zhengdingensis]